MQLLARAIHYILIVPLSLLPSRLWYGISDVLAWFMELVIKYRYAVINQNLQRSFPDLHASEIKRLRLRFYQNFCDIFLVENIKALSPFAFFSTKRVELLNPELVQSSADAGKSIILYCGHQANWEVLAHLNVHKTFPFRVAGVYKKQSPIANYLMLWARTRSGAMMFDTQELGKQIAKKHEHPLAWLFIGDQSPSSLKGAYWTQFLNQETGVMTGAEVYARRFDLPVYFCEILRLSRGRYALQFEAISTQPKEMQNGEITERYTQLLEKSIEKHPDAWLWSHRRWKHKKPSGK